MKNIIIISVLLCVVLFLGACAQGTGGDMVNTNIQNNTTGSNSNAVQTVNIPASQMGWTTAVPSEYNEPFDHPGTVVPFDYESKDYAGNGGTVSKTAYVYLPYGYDENDTDIKYDIIYLMHGWGGHHAVHWAFRSDRKRTAHLQLRWYKRWDRKLSDDGEPYCCNKGKRNRYSNRSL